ncbi:COX15/CtaA family protein [Halovivax sp.]|uniref:COX15/CtaA family protein n=1 Tax=Halovivax sp. TaxID=1935978 RepID=UPI0025BB9145|nr:COX15/CtaA family protein [Halovivax sp.]
MASDTPAHDGTSGSLRDRLGFPHLLATTLVLVAATILLGVATKASGAGLACEANWPLCDGGLLNLFPAGFPSFFEWIHRVVAMIAGIFIVAVAVVAWRTAVDRRIAWAVTLGAALTPIQVILGRETVRQYEITILNLHFWAAIVIFLLFAASTVAVWSDRFGRKHATAALGIAAALVPVQMVFSPLVIDSYTPVIQTIQYAISLALLFSIVVAAIVGARHVGRRLATVLAATPVLGLVVVYAGRESVMNLNDPLVQLAYLVVTTVVFLTFVATAVATRRSSVVVRSSGA